MTVTTEKPSYAGVPDAFRDLRLKDVIRTLPKACFQKDRRKAWTQVLLTLSAVAVGYGAIALSPWFLLPFAWFFTGTALTGMFVIGHDCGHRSFANRRWVNDLVGHLMMMPLIYPFHSWRLLHDIHHVETNKLHVDNAWEPWTVEGYKNASPALSWGYRQLRGVFWWVASVAHWVMLHFNQKNFEPRDRNKVKLSVTVVLAFAAVAFPTLIATTGLWGFVKFWLMPWLGYHFWMSTFTLVHHTLPGIQFRVADEWNEVEAQLAGTVHCTYPRWVEVLCHDINVHVPHHISVGIPSYNLRQAHASLRENWGEHLKEYRFSWGLMKQIIQECHLFHPEKTYQRFSDVDR